VNAALHRGFARGSGSRESSGRFSDDRAGSEQLQNARAISGETRAERPPAIQLKSMGDFADDVSRHGANLIAGRPHEGLLTKQIQDAGNAA
jgi:hypothetical protein